MLTLGSVQEGQDMNRYDVETALFVIGFALIPVMLWVVTR